MLENILWMLVVIVLSAVSGILILKDYPNKYYLVLLAELALVLRFIFIFIVYKNGTDFSGTDGLIYHQVAKNIAFQLKSNIPLWNIDYEYTWYTVMMGIQYAIFGINRYAASFMNSFIAILSGYLLIDIVNGIKYSHKKSGFIGVVYLFMPSMIVWTADTRKESMIFFLIILIWNLSLKILKEKKRLIIRNLVGILTVCLLMWLCTLLRIYMIYTLGCGLLVCLMVYYVKTSRKLPLIFSIAVIITCILVTFTTVRVNMRDYHALAIDRTTSSDENLDKEFDSIFNTIMDKDIPSSISGFLTKPHLDEVAFIPDIAANPPIIIIVRIEMILWYVCMIVAIFGIMYTLIKLDPYLLGMLVFIVSYGLVNALISEDVADTYYRYRAAIVAPTLLFADYRLLFNKMKTLIIRSEVVWVRD